MTGDSSGTGRTPGLGGTPGAGSASGQLTHLDAAGAARMSRATLEAQAVFLRAESELGAYAAEVAAADALATASATLADLLGPGLRADDVVFQHNASSAFATLLAAWPLRAGARIATIPSEYGSNRLVLESLAARIGATLLDLPVDEDGRIDLDTLDRSGLTESGAAGPGAAGGGFERLDLVVFPQVPSQRGIAQPAGALGRRCADAGVGLIVDVAQSAGQLDATGIGADAYVGTSRKWLRGPRGAGFVALRPGTVERLGIGVPSLYSAASRDDRRAAPSTPLAPPAPPDPLPGAARISVGESSVVARIGLAQALVELVDAGPAQVFAQVAALGAHGRQVLDGAGGFRVRERGPADLVDPTGTNGGIITLQPPPGIDPFAVRDRLYREHQILTSAIPAVRARELHGPLLRASAHAYNTPADLDRLADALATLAR
ncbi:aminotransferase class V-fold PLP-dependent enzyme [Frankia sp. R82]|uniref:aminotransferase class V-fold PLP-dependent enzyme n=1 Tax=Frankia sp. R82 TaxID=2950553 RepID=UPI002042C69E|nr:aminotransferase class V-fold PLP-dependent enzyme [Frankia sp. R82]MCM3884700.1 aminotransferase class V-fold PLP-dependent enzyme [Frankia sp. R82]